MGGLCSLFSAIAATKPGWEADGISEKRVPATLSPTKSHVCYGLLTVAANALPEATLTGRAP